MRTDWVLVRRKKKSKGVGKSSEGEKKLSSNSLNAGARTEELQWARAPLQRATGGATGLLAGQRRLRGVSALYTKVQWFSRGGRMVSFGDCRGPPAKRKSINLNQKLSCENFPCVKCIVGSSFNSVPISLLLVLTTLGRNSCPKKAFLSGHHVFMSTRPRSHEWA